MRVGITGHQRLVDPSGWTWVKAEIERLLTRLTPPLAGITSLAVGADQLFAQIILDLGGNLEVVVPFQSYATRFSEAHDRDEYERFLAAAAKVEVLPDVGSDEQAYFAAGKRV